MSIDLWSNPRAPDKVKLTKYGVIDWRGDPNDLLTLMFEEVSSRRRVLKDITSQKLSEVSFDRLRVLPPPSPPSPPILPSDHGDTLPLNPNLPLASESESFVSSRGESESLSQWLDQGEGEKEYSVGDIWLSDEEEGERKGLSEYDWAGGSGTFFIDSEGHIRSRDYGEEIVADHLGSDGTLYDEEGNEIGYVRDGYVYDEEGNRIGTLDTDMSDQWELEKYEEQMAGSEDDILGYHSWGANYEESEDDYTPYHVTSYKKDEDEDEDW